MDAYKVSRRIRGEAVPTTRMSIRPAPAEEYLASEDVALERALARIALLERTAARLGQFVPATVRRMIESDPSNELSKADRDVTILFLDVQSYTALSDRLAPHLLATLIERYFSSFVDVFEQCGGDINETAGDGLMVLFTHDDSRHHAARAARAALAVVQTAQKLSGALMDEHGPLIINVGISSGLASVGPMRFAGSLAVRCTYTATGPVTNYAARLQAEAKDGCVLVGEETATRLGENFELLDLGCRTLRNVAKPQRIFRLIAARAAKWA